jgi:GMP synthase (glutamine-hydrolysing)
VASHALALQFHPEVQAPTLECWYVGPACKLGAARIEMAQLRADSQRHTPPLQEAARCLWRCWLDAAV